jgi:hypothetical protein
MTEKIHLSLPTSSGNYLHVPKDENAPSLWINLATVKEIIETENGVLRVNFIDNSIRLFDGIQADAIVVYLEAVSQNS